VLVYLADARDPHFQCRYFLLLIGLAMDSDWLLAAYDYTLPPAHIAQAPVEPRDSARLLVVGSGSEFAHAVFRDLPSLLQPGDLLILNDTRVIPARLYGRKPSGLPVEVLLLEPTDQVPDAIAYRADLHTAAPMSRWLSLVKPGRRLKPGARIFFGDQDVLETSAIATSETDAAVEATVFDPQNFPLSATVLAADPATGGRILQFEAPMGESVEAKLQQLGRVPLPPYISNTEADPEQYQTVYASQPGAVAAPTAGLHFTPELLDQLLSHGIDLAFVTLHVGVGTFRPVEAEEITQHQMHAEWVEVPAATVEKIQQTKARGGRVIAVGTTAVRSLEGAAAQTPSLEAFCGKTKLFIYPGYQWQVVDGLITNFHLPKSSLMMLVSALIGRQRLLDLYHVAIDAQYRFYSFGDAMLILPEAKLGEGENR